MLRCFCWQTLAMQWTPGSPIRLCESASRPRRLEAAPRKGKQALVQRTSLSTLTNRSNVVDLCSESEFEDLADSDNDLVLLPVASTSKVKLDGQDKNKIKTEGKSKSKTGLAKQGTLELFLNVSKVEKKTEELEAYTKVARETTKEERLARFRRKPTFHWRNSNHKLCFTPPKRRIFTCSPVELAQVLEEMKSERNRATSLDLEWNFNKRTHVQHKPGIVQIASTDTVIVFSVDQAAETLPQCLIDYLADAAIVKAGVAIRSVDAAKLHRDYRNLPTIRGLCELSDLARTVDFQRWEKRGRRGLISLQELTYTYLDAYLEKGQERTSNWEAKGPWAPHAKQMSERQLDYASGDVVAGLLIMQRILDQAPTTFNSQSILTELAPNGKSEDLDNTAKTKPKTKPTLRKPAMGNTRKEEAFLRFVGAEGSDFAQIATSMGIKEKSVVSYILDFLELGGAERLLRMDEHRCAALVAAANTSSHLPDTRHKAALALLNSRKK